MKKLLFLTAGIVLVAVAFGSGFLVAKYYYGQEDDKESYSIHQVKMFSPWDGVLRDHIIRLERNSGNAAFLCIKQEEEYSFYKNRPTREIKSLVWATIPQRATDLIWPVKEKD